MNSFFWGFLFVYINFDFTMNESVLHLVPSFVGFILILKGLREMDEDSPRFSQARPVALGLTIYTGILWVLDLLGLGAIGEGVVSLLLGLIATILSLLVSWRILQGLCDIEQKWEVSLGTDRLRVSWKFLAVTHIAVYVLALMPYLNIAAMLLALAATIAFLYRFHRSRVLYYAPKT